MRTLTSHMVNLCNDSLKVEVLDEPGDGGANHEYRITGFKDASEPLGISAELLISFQNGPIPEHGTNGITHEVLLAILIDRLEGFQRGKFAHGYNADALTSLKSAMASLQQRTRDRIHRGVEGTHTV